MEIAPVLLYSVASGAIARTTILKALFCETTFPREPTIVVLIATRLVDLLIPLGSLSKGVNETTVMQLALGIEAHRLFDLLQFRVLIGDTLTFLAVVKIFVVIL